MGIACRLYAHSITDLQFSCIMIALLEFGLSLHLGSLALLWWVGKKLGHSLLYFLCLLHSSFSTVSSISTFFVAPFGLVSNTVSFHFYLNLHVHTCHASPGNQLQKVMLGFP